MWDGSRWREPNALMIISSNMTYAAALIFVGALLFALWAAGNWALTGEWDAITLGRFLDDTLSMGDVERGFLGLPAFVALLVLVPVFLIAALVCDRTGGWLDRSK
jgi:hypothetical protein